MLWTSYSSLELWSSSAMTIIINRVKQEKRLRGIWWRCNYRWRLYLRKEKNERFMMILNCCSAEEWECNDDTEPWNERVWELMRWKWIIMFWLRVWEGLRQLWCSAEADSSWFDNWLGVGWLSNWGRYDDWVILACWLSHWGYEDESRFESFRWSSEMIMMTHDPLVLYGLQVALHFWGDYDIIQW